jgi:type VI secretion system protein ImpH
MTPLDQPGEVAAELGSLLRAPERFDLFAALRLIEAAFPEQPRLGEGRRARDEPARLTQPPFVAFPPAQIAAIGNTPGTARLRLATYAIGMFGPQGPLPLHVTMRALERSRHGHDPTLAHFVDVFHHRLIALFYRAWAKARPTVEYDRPASDRFARRLSALAGMSTTAFVARSPLPDGFVRYAAGLFAAQARTPEALTRLITLFFEVPVRIREFVGAWLEIPQESRTRLGRRDAASLLAADAVLGIRTYARGHRFRVLLGPLRFAQFERFLPFGSSLPTLRALVRQTVGMQFDWDLQLVLQRAEVPAARLDGEARLGWTAWLDTEARAADADDLVLPGSIAEQAQ